MKTILLALGMLVLASTAQAKDDTNYCNAVDTAGHPWQSNGCPEGLPPSEHSKVDNASAS